MSEAITASASPGAPTTASPGTITPAAVETFKAQAKAHGLSDEQIARTLRLNGIEKTEHAENQKTALGGNGDGGLVAPNQRNVGYLDPVTKRGGYSAADAQKAYENWIKLGLPEEDIRRALEADGWTRIEDGKSEAEEAFDSSSLGPAASASEYKLSYVGRPSVPTADLVALDQDFREAFHAASVPPTMAQGVLDSLLDSMDAWNGQTTDAARGLYKQEQKVILARMGDLERLITLASLPLGRMPRDMRDELHERGCLESAAAVRRLAQIGEVILEREARTKR
jgi:hypothetical protein